ncbi:MAG: hypothetical protein D3923_01575 [Candidatus Electrothrix sp. AR3]|nr:hypothetical protein [Candidatus Electrothrix sp. AR3]
MFFSKGIAVVIVMGFLICSLQTTYGGMGAVKARVIAKPHLNIRKEANAHSAILGNIRKGVEIHVNLDKIAGASTSWCSFNYGGKTAYLWLPLLDIDDGALKAISGKSVSAGGKERKRKNPLMMIAPDIDDALFANIEGMKCKKIRGILDERKEVKNDYVLIPYVHNHTGERKFYPIEEHKLKKIAAKVQNVKMTTTVDNVLVLEKERKTKIDGMYALCMDDTVAIGQLKKYSTDAGGKTDLEFMLKNGLGVISDQIIARVIRLVSAK